mgnify:CR=1 FL=1
MGGYSLQLEYSIFSSKSKVHFMQPILKRVGCFLLTGGKFYFFWGYPLLFSYGEFSLVNSRNLLERLFIFPTRNINFHLAPKDRKPETLYRVNVMSEQVKMSKRHFLRCDYLHIHSI